MPKELYNTKVGDRYGTRIITALLKERDTDGHLRCRWKCDCGKVGAGGLKSLRHTSSCFRCKPKPLGGIPRHGHCRKGKRTKLYDAWANMMQRTRGTGSDRNRKWYFDKGVRACLEWQSFDGFSDWALANGWREGMSLDRKDTTGNYEPSNCEWVTREENSRRAAVLLKELYALRQARTCTGQDRIASGTGRQPRPRRTVTDKKTGRQIKAMGLTADVKRKLKRLALQRECSVAALVERLATNEEKRVMEVLKRKGRPGSAETLLRGQIMRCRH
jgi:hypothetical protein